MNFNQLYTSNGRIRKIILFDTKNYTLPAHKDGAERFEAIRNKHINFINGMHSQNNEIWFYIFYRKTNASGCSGTYSEQAIKTRFIAVNELIPRLYIPTRWTQSVFLIGPGQALLYDNSTISDVLAQVVVAQAELSRAIPLYESCELKELEAEEQAEAGNLSKSSVAKNRQRISGGEIQLGYRENAGENYMLHGLDASRMPDLSDRMEKLFQMNLREFAKNIQSLDTDFTREYDKPFYHLDYFCMLLGRMPNENREGVIVSVPYVFNPAQNGRDCDHDWPETQAFSRPPIPYPMNYNGDPDDPKNVLFRHIELPMYLFPKNDQQGISPGNIDMVLSYANCLVENYRIRSWRNCKHGQSDADKKACPVCKYYDKSNLRINVYFPDYRGSMRNYVACNYADKNRMRCIQRFLEKTPDVKIEAGENWGTLREAFSTLDSFFDRVHLHIRKQLAKHNIHNVQFVSHDFFTLAQNGGALHCIAKVVERDRVN